MGASNADYQLPGSAVIDGVLTIRKNSTAIELVVNGTALITLAADGTVYLPGTLAVNGNGIVDAANGQVVVSSAQRLTAGTANPDTSGATLGALETEVNQLKALLRAAGLLAT